MAPPTPDRRGLSGTVAIGDDSAGTGAVVTADNHLSRHGAALGARPWPHHHVGRARRQPDADRHRPPAASAPVTMWLRSPRPPPPPCPPQQTAGQTHVIKAAGAGVTVTLATTSSQTIDGAAPGTVPPWESHRRRRRRQLDHHLRSTMTDLSAALATIGSLITPEEQAQAIRDRQQALARAAHPRPRPRRTAIRWTSGMTDEQRQEHLSSGSLRQRRGSSPSLAD